MKTLEELLTYKGGDACNLLDGRDKLRLASFFPAEDVEKFGFKLKEGMAWNTLPYSEEEIMRQFASDFAFAKEKAESQRGISANLMAEVLAMWCWVLNDEETASIPYDNYGWPIIEAVAKKYGEKFSRIKIVEP